jgi:hypothetical protein
VIGEVATTYYYWFSEAKASWIALSIISGGRIAPEVLKAFNNYLSLFSLSLNSSYSYLVGTTSSLSDSETSLCYSAVFKISSISAFGTTSF